MTTPFPPDDERLEALRDALPALAAGIYLNAGTAGPLPAEAAAAMDEVAAWELRTGRASPALFPETLQRLEEARAAVAAVLHADLDAVALTHSTTDGLGIAAAGIDWRPGDRVVVTSLEHVGLLGHLYGLRDRFGIELVIADVGNGADDERTLAAIGAAIDERTRLVALSHVAWTTGAVLPVAAVAAIAHDRRDVLVLVDGAQSAGAIATDPGVLGADAYAIPAQKWLLGPEGMGALWVGPRGLERLVPSAGGFLSFERSDTRGLGLRWAGARRFEATNFHRPSVVGFARSCGWLAMFVGLEWALERGPRLTRVLAERLAAIPGVRLGAPSDRLATLVSFTIDGWTAAEVCDELGRRVFAIVRQVPGELVRVSVGWFSSGAELERFATAVELLAAHTPATLPRRSALPILGEDPA